MTTVTKAATIPDFNAEQFAYLHGSLLSFRFSIPTRIIDTCKGYKHDKLDTHSLNDFTFYQPDIIKAIIELLETESNYKSKIKISFSLYDESNSCNIIHNLYFDPKTPEYWHFHLNFNEKSVEEFLKIVFVYIWHETTNEYTIKSTYNNLSRTKELHNSEYEVLKLWTQGYSSKEIAEILHYSVHTISDFKQCLYEKFRSVSIYQLIRNARKEGFI